MEESIGGKIVAIYTFRSAGQEALVRIWMITLKK